MDSTYANFNKDYIKQFDQAFNASLFSVKFANRQKTANSINAWVSEKNNKKITDIVFPEDFKSKSGNDASGISSFLRGR